jgi:hypothetical protein
MKSTEDLIRAAQERLYRSVPALRPASPKPIPEDGRLVLGRDKHGLPFALDTRLLSAHIDMVGGIGGGKSSAMRHLAWLNMETATHLNRATIIIDPHGQHEDSLFRTTLRRIVETRLHLRKKVFVIDPNSGYCTGLNLLQGEAEPSVMADHMIEGFERLQGDENLLEKPTLRRALHGLLAILSELRWSLAQADLLLDPEDPHGLRQWALERITDRYARKALLRLERLANDPRLHKEFEIETIGTENRLAALLSSRAMRAIVGCQMLDMRVVLDQGAVLLVNTAGLNASSETAGDLLGKLIMRAVLFAAKRRQMNSLALVFADECARYVSEDWERALAELRKYRVGICSAHQTFAMLGMPDDPVRQAIEQIPATKIAFRLNSMEEATTVAPELVKLNLELPVKVLVKESVVGYELRRMRSASTGVNSARMASRGRTDGQSVGVSHTEGESIGESRTDTQSRQTSVQVSIGRSRMTGFSEQETEGESSTYSHTAARSRGGSRSEQSGTASGESFAQTFDVPVDAWQSGESSYGRAAAFGIANGRTVSAGYDRSRSAGRASSEEWSQSDSDSEAHSSQRSRGWARSEATTTSEAVARGTTDGASHARGISRERSKSAARSQERSASVSLGNSLTEGTQRASGWTESLAPVLKRRPSAVHSLENVKHMAAEMLCSLPTGVAVVRTLQNGTIEGAVVQVPYRGCAPVSDEQYASDLSAIMPRSIGLPMADAMRSIERRERQIVEQVRADALPAPEPTDPQEFRVRTTRTRGENNA